VREPLELARGAGPVGEDSAHLFSLDRRRKLLLTMPLIVLVAGLAANTAKARDDIQTLRDAIAAYHRSHICPHPGIYPILQFESYCKPYCDRSVACHGNVHSDPCEQDSGSDACHQQEEGSQQCLQEMNEKNQIIADYDQIARQCPAQETTRTPPTSGNSSKPAGAALVGASQQAQQQADAARAKARAVTKKAAEDRAREQAAKEKLKKETSAPSPACQQAVAECGRRNAELANLTPETLSKCDAYCRNMQIENCNPSSSTLNENARICVEGAKKDQKDAVERASKLREQRRLELERAARAQAAEERRKWHCFGEAGSISRGFAECKSECRAYFSASHCASVCYASGEGSISNGRSCFREP
jgi:hypothetical protein